MTNTFEIYLKEHVERYPKAQPQDLYKLCFQAAFGAEHLLQDEERAWQYLQREYENVPTLAETDRKQQPLLEWIAPEVVRVHLAVHKSWGLSLENLFRAFVQSAREFKGDKGQLAVYLEVIEQMTSNDEMPFSKEDWTVFCRDRETAPVHHSDIYREAYKPSYRVIAGRHIANLETEARHGN